ncbi:MAG TPA: 2-oxoglutarate and iron-dependent oxygenase domain-containing protein, partial [Myxococcaceae bacterium]|nr:2-oxoglutarate and iron-dependent oxygenase domain-containing protein [Myxococcaceae bacterium]
MSKQKEHGISARNREFIHYDQVEKRQDYQLAEAAAKEEFDEDFKIKTCDLGRFLRGDSKDQQRFAGALGEALEEIGFAILEGHGIDSALYDEAHERVIELFTQTPLEQKLRFAAQRHGSVNQGYFPMKETSQIHPDLVEGWVFCRRAFEPLRAAEFWPDPPMQGFFGNLCRQHEALILPVMQSILTYFRCDPHSYDRRLSATNFGLRLNYYPPINEQDDVSGAGRLLGHEDIDLFTFLPAPTIEGLQVLNRRNMKWIRLHAPRGTVILNTGDYIQRITNDLLPSTTHRVSKPRDPALRRVPRASFPMNVYLWEDELLEVLPGLREPKYEPIKAITFHTRTTSKYYGDDYAVQ